MPVALWFFQLAHIPIFYAAIICFLASGTLKRRYTRWSVLCLFLCALLVRLFTALQDPFLHEWDEQFHILVARNMIDDPFTPVLVKMDVGRISTQHWAEGHIWLHKQPLFMWLMALSMKLFGISVFAARYPSVLMGVLMVPMLYDVVMQLTNRKDIAWVAAVILCFSNFQLQQISGTMGMDHNDVAFSFFILASFWAYARYTAQQQHSWRYALLIGIMAGCAVLSKWLTGILVYAGWGINLLLQTPQQRRKEAKHLAVAVMVTVLVFLPWQLYIHQRFPEEAAYEAALNNRHLWERVEGHWGTNFFYLDAFPEYFGEIGWFLVPAGFVVLLLQLRKRRIPNAALGNAVLVWFTVTFVFFSYVATTKIIGFFYIVAPLGIIFMAVAGYEMQRQFQLYGRQFLAHKLPAVLFSLTIVSILNPERIAAKHNPNDPNRLAKIANVAVYQHLGTMIPRDVHIVVNANHQEAMLAMFYNNHLRVYSHLPLQPVWDSLMAHKVPMAAFASRPGYLLPKGIEDYKNVHIIHTALQTVKYLD